jgi:hypothetical protein
MFGRQGCGLDVGSRGAWSGTSSMIHRRLTTIFTFWRTMGRCSSAGRNCSSYVGISKALWMSSASARSRRWRTFDRRAQQRAVRSNWPFDLGMRPIRVTAVRVKRRGRADTSTTKGRPGPVLAGSNDRQHPPGHARADCIEAAEQRHLGAADRQAVGHPVALSDLVFDDRTHVGECPSERRYPANESGSTDSDGHTRVMHAVCVDDRSGHRQVALRHQLLRNPARAGLQLV